MIENLERQSGDFSITIPNHTNATLTNTRVGRRFVFTISKKGKVVNQRLELHGTT